MERRIVLQLLAVGGLATLSPALISLAAEQPAPGTSTTVAGTGPAGLLRPRGRAALSGAGAPATGARLDDPHGLAIDAAGNLFFADTGNHRIRKVSPEGTITTVAGSGPIGTDKGVVAGDGGPATAATLRGPMG